MKKQHRTLHLSLWIILTVLLFIGFFFGHSLRQPHPTEIQNFHNYNHPSPE